jgi:hypothetical protein
MCSIDALTLAPYLIPAFAGAFLVSSTLMCFMRRSYEQILSKVAGRVTLLEQQQQQQQQQQPLHSYYPPVAYPIRGTAPPLSLI